ncbi:endonuclease domain-containing 1 protein-like isoform X1 [Anguilla anguilla]|uniref:endonuclease domain-containing 1 protein-like isoform X1 n=1 Tax=Anguilla anguilla TaxID=7936 RepID=UPI0015A9BF93|nr:endonuclease domain-containing 1 protein-like isoform X1 [Anguilla anguilla]
MQVLAALCFLVLAHLPPLRGEVVGSFQDVPDCLDFFYEGWVPEWGAANPNAARLCQRLNNRYHFATLYDTSNRIAIYSAYLFQTKDNKSTENEWCIEPQLVNMSWEKDMKDEKDLKGDKDKVNVYFGERQALDEDYLKSKYDRGHLNPKQHQSGDSRQATFTLTNVVPQNRNLNNGNWSKYETDLQINLTRCWKAYVLVGAIPSNNTWIGMNNTKRVNVPKYIWNAYCCLGKKSQPLHSGGAIAPNTDPTRVKRHTLSELKLLLGQYTNSPVEELFHNNCEA